LRLFPLAKERGALHQVPPQIKATIIGPEPGTPNFCAVFRPPCGVLLVLLAHSSRFRAANPFRDPAINA
jgi:hypothetical protein